MYPLKNLPKYDSNALSKTFMTYTTVYLGNYVSGDYDEGGGSHPGVDIVPKIPGDTVHSVLPGIVLEAKENASEGKFVVIQHDNVLDSETGAVGSYVSNYLHLSAISVAKGQVVSEGDVIGNTGSTGQSTAEHLHFQIDTIDAPFHPYWPFTFKEANDLHLGFFEAVNRGLWIEKAEKYTVSPLSFLDRVKTVIGTTPAIPSKPSVANISTHKEEVKIAASVTPAPALVFSDVPANHVYAEAISYVKEKGIAAGQNGKFSPDAWVTRGEILKMAFVASKKSLSSDVKSYFSDVPSNSPFIQYINTAREMKAVGGYADGTFGPNNPVTRAEWLKIVLSILSVPLEKVTGPVYIDVGLQDTFAPYILWSRENEVLAPSRLNFLPNARLTRAEVANIIYQALTK